MRQIFAEDALWICVSWDTAEQHNGLKIFLRFILIFIHLHERMKIEEVWGENMMLLQKHFFLYFEQQRGCKGAKC